MPTRLSVVGKSARDRLPAVCLLRHVKMFAHLVRPLVNLAGSVTRRAGVPTRAHHVLKPKRIVRY
ncbi:Uncharacterised protein [Vibrio cholerae]|nr:Uncharacterised protein [Vibrio cholerae]